jgi:hypothetical protein
MKRSLYMALLLLFTSCMVKDRTKAMQEVTSNITDGAISLKDSDMLITSLETITDVPRTYKSPSTGSPLPVDIPAEVTAFRDFLPRKGIPEEVNAESLRATLGIAGAFCAGLINKDFAMPNSDKGKRRVFIEVDVTSDSTSLTNAIRRAVFSRLSRLAWYRDATEEEMDLLLKTLTEAQAGVPASVAETKQLLLLGCTAILGTPDTLRN